MKRSELYAKVWEVPLSKLGPALGLTDVGLRKLCRRFSIPVPAADARRSQALVALAAASNPTLSRGLLRLVVWHIKNRDPHAQLPCVSGPRYLAGPVLVLRLSRLMCVGAQFTAPPRAA